MFYLIVRTVGEQHLMHSCDEDIFSGSVLQIIVRKKLQKCLQQSRTKVSLLVALHDMNSDTE